MSLRISVTVYIQRALEMSLRVCVTVYIQRFSGIKYKKHPQKVP